MASFWRRCKSEARCASGFPRSSRHAIPNHIITPPPGSERLHLMALRETRNALEHQRPFLRMVNTSWVPSLLLVVIGVAAVKGWQECRLCASGSGNRNHVACERLSIITSPGRFSGVVTGEKSAWDSGKFLDSSW